MAYCTQTDLVKAKNEQVLIELTDPDGSAIDADVVTAAIARADGIINGYLRNKYTLPLTSTPDEIADASIRITLYLLYARHLDSAPEGVKADYDAVLKWLKDVAKGLVDLDVDEAGTQTTSGDYGNEYFDSDLMDEDLLES